MMREKTIEKTIKEFIAKELMIDPNKIVRETNLVNDLNASSMDIVNIVTAIESKFKITFPSDANTCHKSYTLQFLIDIVVSNLKTKPTTRKARKSTNSDCQ